MNNSNQTHEAQQIPAEDQPLIRKQKQLHRIWIAPHRHGINYLKLMDRRKEIANQLYMNSVKRAMGV
jgi:hypothetical protein